jgi:phosphatidylserine/phosphatidylglycerophosphate/cardiolipin synthase-like enzyme
MATEVKVYFSPNGGCEDAIVEAISHANREIEVAMYAFTSRNLARALVNAKRRGVKVKVVLDGSFNTENQYSKGEYLRRSGIPIRLVTPHGQWGRAREWEGKMHNKFAIIDGSTVITGSYNWTTTAELVNHENLIVFTNAQKVASAYLRGFHLLWNR